MERTLQLSWNHVSPSDALAEHIRELAARLERYHGRITGCAVTLEARSRHHRHSGSMYRVRIVLTVPGGQIVVGRDPDAGDSHEDLYAAVNAAFDEARRRLQIHASRMHRVVKTHAAPPIARVARLMPQDGYGFLVTPDDREIYFHERSVLNGGFRRLKVGTVVRFAEELGDNGPQASTVAALRRPRHLARVEESSTP